MASKPVQFAPVAPIQILEELQVKDMRELYGNYHLFLAHHTVENPARFASLVHKHVMAEPYKDITIIMDNSIVELGGAVDDAMIAEAVEIVSQEQSTRFSVIPCLPDVMGVSGETIDLSSDAYSRWKSNGMPGDGYMLVTQGETFEDFCRLVDHFFVDEPHVYSHIRWVGIPRKLADTIGTRAMAIQYIQMVAPHIKIHLLGFSRNIADDLFCARMAGVRGIDSAVPVRYNHILTPMTSDEQIGPRGDWMRDGFLTQHNANNIRNVRQWIQTRG